MEKVLHCLTLFLTKGLTHCIVELFQSFNTQ